jgi:hypothetical protein
MQFEMLGTLALLVLMKSNNGYASFRSLLMLIRCRYEAMAVPWLRGLVISFSPRRPRFAPWSFRVGFVVDKSNQINENYVDAKERDRSEDRGVDGTMRMDHREIGWKVEWIRVAKDRDQ